MVTKEKSNSNGIASLVLGIVSVVLPILGINLAAGIVGIILAKKQKKIYPNGIATAGFILSIIGLAVWGLIYLMMLLLVGSIGMMGASAIGNLI